MANPDAFLQDKFLDVGMYPNALDLYKDDLVELRDQLKIKVFAFYICIEVFLCCIDDVLAGDCYGCCTF